MLCIGCTCYVWTLNANDFAERMKNQVIGSRQANKTVGDLASAYTQWFFRFPPPTGSPLGFGMIGFTIFEIVGYPLK